MACITGCFPVLCKRKMPKFQKQKKSALNLRFKTPGSPPPELPTNMVDTSGNPGGCKCHFSNGSLSAVITA